MATIDAPEMRLQRTHNSAESTVKHVATTDHIKQRVDNINDSLRNPGNCVRNLPKPRSM